MNKKLALWLTVAFLALAGVATWAGIQSGVSTVLARGNCISDCG
jgi:hypothetical protein